MPSRTRIFRDFVRNVVTATLLVREVLVCLVILIFLHGLLFSFVEGKDVGSSIYFAFITAFTIGYGDIVPATTLGRIVAVLIGLWGTIFVGLVVAINTRALRETVKEVTPQEPA
jgi:voltage-gated potassium channel